MGRLWGCIPTSASQYGGGASACRGQHQELGTLNSDPQGLLGRLIWPFCDRVAAQVCQHWCAGCLNGQNCLKLGDSKMSMVVLSTAVKQQARQWPLLLISNYKTLNK